MLLAGAHALHLFRLIVIGILVAILASLGTALYHLNHGRGDSSRMLRALTWRVGLSVALFALLCLAVWRGWVAPRYSQ